MIVVGRLFVGWDFLDLDYVGRGFTFREGRGIVFNSGQLQDRVIIADCIVEENANDCDSWYAGGISIPAMSDFVRIDSCIVRNSSGCRAGGLSLRGGVVRNSLIVGNEALEGGGGILMQGGLRLVIESNTIARNRVMGSSDPKVGSGVEIRGGGPLQRVTMLGTIVASNAGGAGISCAQCPVMPAVSCTDAWANEGGNYAGFPDPTGTNGNISLDPESCDPEMGDYRLRAASPCAPEHSPPGCGLIGALPVGCGVEGIEDRQVSSARPRLVVLPNPASGLVEFRMSKPPGSAVIVIYSSRGEAVHVLTWSGRPIRWQPGAEVSSSVYFARALAGGQPEVAKFVFMR